MLKYVVAYLGTALAFAAVDYVWLTRLSTKLYRPTLDPILADKVAMAPAVVFYAVYVLGVLLLVILPAAKDGSWMKATGMGAILGAMAYATYDLTNQATMKVWSTQITIADIAWGAFLTSVGATAGYFTYRWGERSWG